MNSSSRMVWALGAGLLACALGGCGYGHFNMEVALDENDEGLRGKLGKTVQSIEVNLIGVNDTEFRRWEQVPMSQYWQPDNPFRLSAKKYVMTFGGSAARKQLLARSDPIWDVWQERNATHLFVLAYLPWITQDQPGEGDPRRIILPLKISCWDGYNWGANDIPIQLGSGGITSLRQHKCKKK
jgi:hypothetical protein